MSVILPITPDAASANVMTGPDRSLEFNNFFSGAGKQKIVEISGGYNTTTANGGYCAGASSVLVPFGSSIQGTGQSAKIYIGPNANTPLFRVNTDSNSNLIISSDGSVGPGFGNCYFRDFYVSGRWLTGNNTSDVPVFQLGASATIENMLALDVQTLVRSPAFYLDQITIRKCTIGAQPVGTNFAVELNASSRAGDGLVIDQLHLTDAASAGARPRAVQLNNARGGQITNGINGDHQFNACTGINFSGFHGENGEITWRGSSGISADNCYWMRTGLPFGVTPVNVLPVSGAGSIVTSSLHFRNEKFIYQVSNAFPWDTSKNHISIANNVGSVEIEDCHATMVLNGITSAASGKAGIRTGNKIFDAYSHFASVKSKFSVDEWLIHGSHGSVGSYANGVYTAPSGLEDGATQINPAFGTWNLPSLSTESFYFKVVVYLDRQRQIGRVTNNVVSRKLTQGGGAIVLALNIGRGPKMVRVYIGKGENAYDRYIDIPWIDGTYLPCEGDRIMGWQAIERPAGPPDPVYIRPARYMLCPGNPVNSPTDVNPSAAYGNVEVWNYANALPEQGTWNQGDVVHWMTPTATKRGHVRLTTGGGHVLGTDWAELSL